MPELFLIYHSEVRPMAKVIRERLASRLPNITITMDENAGHAGRDAVAASNKIIARCDVVLCVSKHDGLDRSRYLRKEVSRVKSLIARKQRSRLFLIVTTVGTIHIPSLSYHAPLFLPNQPEELDDTHLDQISRSVEDSLNLANDLSEGAEIHDWELLTTSVNVQVLNVHDPTQYCDSQATISFVRQAREKTPQLLPLIALMIESGSFAQFYNNLLTTLNINISSNPFNGRISTDLLMELAMETIYTVDIPLLKTFHSIHPRLTRKVESIRTALKNQNDIGSVRDQIEEEYNHGQPGEEDIGNLVINFLRQGYYILLECVSWKMQAFSSEITDNSFTTESLDYLERMLSTDLTSRSQDPAMHLKTSISFDSLEQWDASAKSLVRICRSNSSNGSLICIPPGVFEILTRDPDLGIATRTSIRESFVEKCIGFGNALCIIIHTLDLWQERGNSILNDSDLRIIKRRVNPRLEDNWSHGTVETSNQLLLEYIKMIGISQGYIYNEQND